MGDYRWKPIERLSGKDRAIDLVSIQPLYETWRSAKEHLRTSSPRQIDEFNRRLVRRMSIETGILERIYDIDRGTTEALVTRGFVEDLIGHSSATMEPSRLIDILRDQEAAVHLVMDWVSHRRELTKGLMHELHTTLTRHQPTTNAVDQFGNRLEIPLVRGKFKEQPNNPRRADGAVHEYCPPVHVESEIDNLLQWFHGYSNEDPIIAATWLHHRFTQIHPYQDGNGRVARTLTTMALLRAGLLPLVVDRELRTQYIEALEHADHGDLTPLTDAFARLERSAILQALSVDVDAEVASQESLTGAVIDSLADKFSKRKTRTIEQLQQVNPVAEALREQARQFLDASFGRLTDAVSGTGKLVQLGGPDEGNAYWYKFEVVKTAKEAGKFANFGGNHYFVKAAMQAGPERLVFVVSLHHVGRELTGIMEATAFARLESLEQSEDRELATEDFFVCSLDPFVFTYKTTPSDVTAAFEKWLDAALALAVKEYGDRI